MVYKKAYTKMKIRLFIVLLMAMNALHTTGISQTLNWSELENTKHVLNANVGLDYSVSYVIGYGYRLRTKLPVVLTANFLMPAGEDKFDDFKTKIGGQVCIIDKGSLKGAISLFGIYRHHQTQLVRLQNFGSEMKGTFGYYKKRGFLAAEVGFDKAIVTHFKHAQRYKDEIYADVVDGWYEPATGGNFYYGLQGGYSLKTVDVTINLGKVVSQDFKTMPFLPFYLNLGLNYRLMK